MAKTAGFPGVARACGNKARGFLAAALSWV